MKKKYLSVKKISVKVLSAVLAASMSIGNAGAMKSASGVMSEDIIPDSQNSSPISSSSGSQSSSPTTPPLERSEVSAEDSEGINKLTALFMQDPIFAQKVAKLKARQQIQELIEEAQGNFGKVFILFTLNNSLAIGFDPDTTIEELRYAKDKDPEFFSSAKRLCDDYRDIFANVFDLFCKQLADSVNARIKYNEMVYDV